MINKMSTLVEYDHHSSRCNRAKLDTGTQCNYNCWFCYYKDKLNEITPLEVIKGRVDYLVSCGIREVDLSGGESSIHPNWFEILEYCVSKDMSISTLSNGSMFCCDVFITKSFNYGLKEILFSLHGYDEQSHNNAVGNPNAFRNIMRAIKNANDLGITVRINCVVTKDNYQHLEDDYVSLIHSIECLEVNFLTLNFWGEFEGEVIEYKIIANHIKRTIDKLDVKYVNVRYIPYCYMVGYEQYVCNVYQHIYDVYDWNMALYNENLTPGEYVGNELACLFNAAGKDRIRCYKKQKKCLDCKYFFICDGLENEISEQKVYPVNGDRIRDANHYRKGYYED